VIAGGSGNFISVSGWRGTMAGVEYNSVSGSFSNVTGGQYNQAAG